MPRSSEPAPPLKARELLDCLDRRGVEYLVVGGVGANAYGAQRLTHDLDCLVNMPGADGRRLSYEDLVERSAVVYGTGFAIRSAALEDIIASKEWANRPKDQEALPELRAIAAQNQGAEPGASSPS